MNETNAARLPWSTSFLWVGAAMFSGFLGLKLGPKSLVVHRWWIDSPTDVPDGLLQGFLAIAACCYLASTLVLSVGSLVFPRSGTRPILVSLFVTAGLFLLILALVSLAASDLMRWL